MGGMFRSPSVATCAGLACGFAAIVSAAQSDFARAAVLIGAAALLDALDGMAARASSTESEFGQNLDSLSDLVSFGVAPAFVIYTRSLHELEVFGAAVCAGYLVCGALRLARFPLVKGGRYFIGLPIPPAGVALALVSLLGPAPPLALSCVMLLSGLMVSTMPFPTFPAVLPHSFFRHQEE